MKIYNFYNVNIQLPRFFTFFCLVVLTSCMSFGKSSTPKDYMVDTFFKKLDSGEIYLGMPMDDFMSVVNIRAIRPGDNRFLLERSEILDRPTFEYHNSSILHRSLKEKGVNFSKTVRGNNNTYITFVHTTFFQVNGDWILGDASHFEIEDDYRKEDVKIFNKYPPGYFYGMLLEFESLLISKYGYGTEEQKFC